MASARRVDRALAGLLAGIVVFAIWCVPIVPTHDGPNHLANCVLANRLEDPGSSLHQWLELGAPLTNLGFQAVCEAIEPLLGWRAAYSTTLTVIALVWALGFTSLASSIYGGPSPLLGLGFATALSWPFYMGFFDFVLAAGLTFWWLGRWARAVEATGSVEEPGPRELAVLGLGLLVIALAHTFVAALGGLAAVMIVLFGGPAAVRARRIGGLVLASLPAAAIAVLARPDDEPGGVVWRTFPERMGELAGYFVGGPALRAWPPVVLALAGLLLGVRGVVRRELSAPQKALLLFAVVSLGIYAIAPRDLESWAFFSPRLLTLALPFAALAVPRPLLEEPRARGTAHLLTGGAALLSLGWSITHHRELTPLLDEALAGLGAQPALAPRTGPRLPLMLSLAGDGRSVNAADPLVMILHLYLFDQGGVDPYLYADVPSRDRIMFKDDPKRMFGYFPARFLKNDVACAGRDAACPTMEVQAEWHAVFGRAFEDTIVLADDPVVFEVFERRGYVADVRAGRLGILRPRRCRVELDVVAPAGEPAPRQLVMAFGHEGLPVPTQEGLLPLPPPLLEGPDCGALWLALGGEQLTCAEAGADGRLHFEATPERPASVRCTLTPSPAAR